MAQLIQFITNHPLLVAALFAVAVLLIMEEKKGGTKGLPGITPQGAVDLINHKNAKIIDVRSTEAFTNSHIIDAINIPAGELALNQKRLNRYKNRPLILVCNTGQDSAKIGAKLKQQGLANLHVLKGGTAAWEQAKLPLTKKV